MSETISEFDYLSEIPLSVLYFWASWNDPCKQTTEVASILAREYSEQISFFQIEAEKLPSLSTHYEVTSVPTVFLLKYGAVFDRFTGVDIPLFVAACARLANSINITPSLPTSTISSTSTAIDINATQLQSNGLSDSEFQIYLSKLVCHAPVMLFIKGTPNEPRCGFSRQLIAMVQAERVHFDYFDILTDERVRQGLKVFSNWQFYPQLYVDGKMIGGLDVIKELHSNGEFSSLFSKEMRVSDNEDKTSFQSMM